MKTPKTPLEILADELGMPADHVREAAEAIRHKQMKERLLEKVRIIRSGNTAITPTGEIVDRTERPDAMPYESTQAPPTEYRDLKADEEILEGDEYLNGFGGGWEPVDKASVGRFIGRGSVGCFRRKETKP